MSEKIQKTKKRRERFRFLAQCAEYNKIGEHVGKFEDNCHRCCPRGTKRTSISGRNHNPLICCAYCATAVHVNCIGCEFPLDWTSSTVGNEVIRCITRFVCYECELRCKKELESEEEEESSDQESVSDDEQSMISNNGYQGGNEEEENFNGFTGLEQVLDREDSASEHSDVSAFGDEFEESSNEEEEENERDYFHNIVSARKHNRARSTATKAAGHLKIKRVVDTSHNGQRRLTTNQRRHANKTSTRKDVVAGPDASKQSRQHRQHSQRMMISSAGEDEKIHARIGPSFGKNYDDQREGAPYASRSGKRQERTHGKPAIKTSTGGLITAHPRLLRQKIDQLDDSAEDPSRNISEDGHYQAFEMNAISPSPSSSRHDDQRRGNPNNRRRVTQTPKGDTIIASLRSSRRSGPANQNDEFDLETSRTTSEDGNMIPISTTLCSTKSDDDMRARAPATSRIGRRSGNPKNVRRASKTSRSNTIAPRLRSPRRSRQHMTTNTDQLEDTAKNGSRRMKQNGHDQEIHPTSRFAKSDARKHDAKAPANRSVGEHNENPNTSKTSTCDTIATNLRSSRQPHQHMITNTDDLDSSDEDESRSIDEGFEMNTTNPSPKDSPCDVDDQAASILCTDKITTHNSKYTKNPNKRTAQNSDFFPDIDQGSTINVGPYKPIILEMAEKNKNGVDKDLNTFMGCLTKDRRLKCKIKPNKILDEFEKGRNKEVRERITAFGHTYELVSSRVVKDESSSFRYGSNDSIELYYINVMVEGSGKDLGEYFSKFGNFEKLTTRKAAARLELFTSPLRMFPDGEYVRDVSKDIIDDIEECGHEGCGFIDEDYLHDLLGRKKDNKPRIASLRTTSIQPRLFIPSMGIYKGVLVKKRMKTGSKVKIQLPSSMKKVEASVHPDRSDKAYIVICQAGQDGIKKKAQETKFTESAMITRLLKALTTEPAQIIDYFDQCYRDKDKRHNWLRGVSVSRY